MTIKIKELTIVKDVLTSEIVGFNIVSAHRKLKGDINVEISEGSIKGNSKVAIDTVSEDLQDELYKVLNKIEDELNGVGKDEDNTPKAETINITLNVKNVAGTSDIDEIVKQISESLKRGRGI